MCRWKDPRRGGARPTGTGSRRDHRPPAGAAGCGRRAAAPQRGALGPVDGHRPHAGAGNDRRAGRGRCAGRGADDRRRAGGAARRGRRCPAPRAAGRRGGSNREARSARALPPDPRGQGASEGPADLRRRLGAGGGHARHRSRVGRPDRVGAHGPLRLPARARGLGVGLVHRPPRAGAAVRRSDALGHRAGGPRPGRRLDLAGAGHRVRRGGRQPGRCWRRSSRTRPGLRGVLVEAPGRPDGGGALPGRPRARPTASS